MASIAGLLALGGGRGWGSLWVVAAVGAGQLAIGWGNDYLDRERDRAAERSDKPLATGAVAPSVVRNSALVALAACIPLSLASGVPSTLVHLGAIGSAFAYNAGLKRSPWSPLPYAFSFGLAPAIVSLGLTPSRWPHAWVLAAAALLGIAGHFTQVLPDIDVDRAQGSRGLPQLLGARPSAIAAGAMLLAATAIVTFGPGRTASPLGLIGLSAAVLLTGVLVAAALADRLRLAFRLTLVVALVAVAAFLAGGGRTL